MPLVESRSWIYTADYDGRFRDWRRRAGYALIVFYTLTPWLSFRGVPLARIDLPGRRLHLLGTVFTPHDTWALALLGIAAALALFLFTSVLGRVWCGWACPQTVWLSWVYRPIERLVEGSAIRRRKRDAGQRDAAYWGRKLLKHGLYLVATAFLTFSFLAWFIAPIEILRGQLGSGGIVTGLLLGGVFHLDAVWFREQFCIYACPYARFQGALMDSHSLVVSYDVGRGEPRREGKKPSGGDCIDCMRCVQVCPTGIDIRDGDQMQCIACASCADACDAVMIKIGKPVGLVGFTTNPTATGAVRDERVQFRGRTAVYLVVLVGVLIALLAGLLLRSPIAVNVARSSGVELFHELPDDRVSNQFLIHITNRSAKQHSFAVTVAAGDADLVAPGAPWAIPAASSVRFPLFVTAPRGDFVRGRLSMTVEIRRDDGPMLLAPLTLLGPGEATNQLSKAPLKRGSP